MADIYEQQRRRQRTSPHDVESDTEEAPAVHGHEGPKWSRTKALCVLIASTVAFALLAGASLRTTYLSLLRLLELTRTRARAQSCSSNRLIT